MKQTRESAAALGHDTHNWQVFQRPRGRTGKPCVTLLAATGNFSLNAAAMAALGQPQAILLSFARDSQQIAMQAADRNDERAYRVTRPASGALGMLTARAFSNYYGIIHGPQARPYLAVMQTTNVGEALVVSFDEQPRDADLDEEES